MEYFDFKLNSIRIAKNRDIGKAEIKIFSLITSNNYNLGLFEDVLKEETTEKRINLLKVAANDILSYKELIQIDYIPDNFLLSFGMNGYSLYRSDKIPEFFDWSLAIFDSDKEIRKIGEFINNFVNHESFDSFAANLLKLATSAATPQIVMATELTKFIGKVISAQLMVNKDDMVGLYIESFNKYQNYPNNNLKGIEIEDLTRNCRISYEIFGKI